MPEHAMRGPYPLRARPKECANPCHPLLRQQHKAAAHRRRKHVERKEFLADGILRHIHPPYVIGKSFEENQSKKVNRRKPPRLLCAVYRSKIAAQCRKRQKASSAASFITHRFQILPTQSAPGTRTDRRSCACAPGASSGQYAFHPAK